MEKNATVYVLEMDYDKIVCPDKETAIKLFEILSESKLKKYETLGYPDQYAFIGKNVLIAIKVYMVDLYNCAEEARVVKANEEKLVKSGIMEKKKKKIKVKEIKK